MQRVGGHMQRHGGADGPALRAVRLEKMTVDAHAVAILMPHKRALLNNARKRQSAVLGAAGRGAYRHVGAAKTERLARLRANAVGGPH